MLADILHAGGVNMRLVGGAVRDFLLGIEPKDFDFAVDHPPEQVMAVLEAANIQVITTGLHHGTITAVVGGEPFELTTLRIDVETDGRHAEVEWTDDWKLDAERRDLTFNAMAIDMDGKLWDYFGGQEDLANDRVRFVGDAKTRLAEDHLRILRWFRFRQKVNSWDTDQEAVDAIRDDAGNLDKISGERVWMEMSKILVGNNLFDTLHLMEDADVLSAVGLIDFNVNQAGFCGQMTDNPITTIAAGLARSNLAEWQVDTIDVWWSLSVDDRNLLKFLVKNHRTFSTPVDGETERLQDLAVNPKVPRQWILELCIAQGCLWQLEFFKTWEVPVFPVRGQDLLDGGMKPGKEVGARMKELNQAWVASRFTMTREDLLDLDG